MDKRKLSHRAELSGAGNSSAVSLEMLHQLAASYFIDRESTLRRLHHIQIATAAIKVGEGAARGRQWVGSAAQRGWQQGRAGQSEPRRSVHIRIIYGKLGALMKAHFSAGWRPGCWLSTSQLAGNYFSSPSCRSVALLARSCLQPLCA